ncbi:response regulator transcription factor [Frankia tisae]|uniref:response regulator transcription factor n=1 Tax=Frankia tisae TaxID=2950104 RepID=UPI0021BE986B|nr:response regulator transcription factor [Frankia tisae]
MRVVIAEDQVLLREGLVRLFEDRGHTVVAALPDATGVLAAVAEHAPDLVVLDIRMPPTFTDEGARTAREVKDAHPEVGVLVLSQHVEARYAVGLVTLGGFGYLLKDRVLDVGEFLAAAGRVAGGGSALDPHVVGTLLAAQGTADPVAGLSARERDALALMAEGLNNTAIARRMVVSERTVEGHVRHLLIKLGLAEVDDGHRRVLAVLAHLRHAALPAPRPPNA